MKKNGKKNEKDKKKKKQPYVSPAIKTFSPHLVGVTLSLVFDPYTSVCSGTTFCV